MMQYLAHNKNSGYALLFAILVSSILLSAGLGISNIVYKELLLSAIGKQSTIAFYAADTGAECALYWNKYSTGILSAPLFPANGTIPGPAVGARAFCTGKNILDTTATRWAQTQTATGASYSFQLDLPNNSGCAFVKVIKLGNATVIDSRGFNTSCDATSNARRVERALRYRI